MIIKIRSLTESLEKKYSLNEAYEVELDDEIDAIMDDDTLSDEEKEAEIGKVLDKHDELNESFVEEWWGQTDEDPFDFAYEYGLTCKALSSEGDETLYRFTGEKEDFDQAIKDGYFFSLDYGADEGHSEDLNESFTLNEAENPDNAEINALIRKVVGRKNISKKDAQALADAGIERDENYDANNNLEEAIAGNSTVQRYIDFSINECYGYPARPWQIYDSSVIEELNDLGLKEVKKAYNLWNKSFSSCINTLPRSKEYAAYYFTWDGGFNILVISEYYKCGIRVVHSKSKYDNNIYTRLSFEDKDGYKVDKTDDSSNSFEVICKEIISLTNDEFNIFRPALNAYAQVEDLLDLYYNHIKIEGPRGDMVLTVDGDPIWSTKEKWDVAD